jgi:peptide/nickel transport system substrate-binding protein
LVDRASIQEHIYGRAGIATGNVLNNPERYRSTKTKWEFDIAKADQVLETGGWKRGPDGIRGRKLTV